MSNVDFRPDLEKPARHTIDTEERFDSQAPSRFFLQRMQDETGVSGTGVVGHGVVFESGKVVFHWRPPMSTVTVYDSFEIFLRVHVTSHPSKNSVVFLDEASLKHIHVVTLAGSYGVEFRQGTR